MGGARYGFLGDASPGLKLLSLGRGMRRGPGTTAPCPSSEGTVRNYLSSAIQKVEARNRMEAVQPAMEQG